MPTGNGSSLLPWSLVVVSLLCRLDKELLRRSIQEYVNNVVILVKRFFLDPNTVRMHTATKHAEKWCCKHELNVDLSKTYMIFLTHSRKIESPNGEDE